MNTLLLLLVVSVLVFMYVNNQNSKIINTLYRNPILDDTSPSVITRIMNGKQNVFMYCNDRDYNFKMNWRSPQFKYNYDYPYKCNYNVNDNDNDNAQVSRFLRSD